MEPVTLLRSATGSTHRRFRVRDGLLKTLADFLARRKHRVTVSDEFIVERTNRHKQLGIPFGQR